jgi:hypothetical protein
VLPRLRIKVLARESEVVGKPLPSASYT